jgi:hypothetical protein
VRRRHFSSLIERTRDTGSLNSHRASRRPSSFLITTNLELSSTGMQTAIFVGLSALAVYVVKLVLEFHRAVMSVGYASLACIPSSRLSDANL